MLILYTILYVYGILYCIVRLRGGLRGIPHLDNHSIYYNHNDTVYIKYYHNKYYNNTIDYILYTDYICLYHKHLYIHNSECSTKYFRIETGGGSTPLETGKF